MEDNLSMVLRNINFENMSKKTPKFMKINVKEYLQLSISIVHS